MLLPVTRTITTESDARRCLDAAAAARIAQRAKRHANLWAQHARGVGLRYLPFAPSLNAEALLRQLVLELP